MVLFWKHCLKSSKLLHVFYFFRKSSSASTNYPAWTTSCYGNIHNLHLSEFRSVIKSPEELFIKIHAASINPIDVKMIGGYGKVLINLLRKQKNLLSVSGVPGLEFPLIPGRDFSGTVVHVGRNVSQFKEGDEVWGALSAEKPGTHSHNVVVTQNEISKKPSNLTHIEAASLPYVAATTWTALCTIGELRETKAVGKRILILGGSGGIGTFATQFAKAWSMHVTVTCSTEAVDLVRGLGADTVIDYKTQKIWEELKSCERFDYILDTVGGEYTSKSLTYLSKWRYAQLVTLVTPLLKNCDDLGAIPGLFRAAMSAGVDTLKGISSGRSLRWAVFVPNGSALDRIRQMVEAQQIKPVIEQVFPFSKVPEAYQRVSEGHLRGKIVIDALSTA